MRKQGSLTQTEGRRLTRRIHKVFNEDWKERALQAGHIIIVFLQEGEAHKAWGTLRTWHKECDPATSRPCYDMLEDQTREREDLYWKRPPPGKRISSCAERPPCPDTRPTDEELRQAAKESSNKKDGQSFENAGGGSKGVAARRRGRVEGAAEGRGVVRGAGD